MSISVSEALRLAGAFIDSVNVVALRRTEAWLVSVGATDAELRAEMNIQLRECHATRSRALSEIEAMLRDSERRPPGEALH